VGVITMKSAIRVKDKLITDPFNYYRTREVYWWAIFPSSKIVFKQKFSFAVFSVFFAVYKLPDMRQSEQLRLLEDIRSLIHKFTHWHLLDLLFKLIILFCMLIKRVFFPLFHFLNDFFLLIIYWCHQMVWKVFNLF
jgi:hypothetical protein